MIFAGLARRCAIAFLFCLGLAGCFPVGDSQSDERKEPHFISGENLVGQMDYQGAVDSFEKAIEVNPRSASAHFELGWLYEQKVNDPAAAIYHYERYLKYSSNPDKADQVRQHINICKVELARTVSAVGPLPAPAQREWERVLLENKDLQTRVAGLQAQLDQANAASAARAQSSAVSPPQNPPVNPAPPRASPPSPRIESPRVAASQPAAPAGNHPAAAAAVRAHTIKAGETLAAVGRKYGVSVSALEAANPLVKPTRLLVGQTLNIPAP